MAEGPVCSLEPKEIELPAHFLKVGDYCDRRGSGGVPWDARRATIMGASPRTGLRGIRREQRRMEVRRGTLLGAYIKFEAEQVCILKCSCYRQIIQN